MWQCVQSLKFLLVSLAPVSSSMSTACALSLLYLVSIIFFISFISLVPLSSLVSAIKHMHRIVVERHMWRSFIA